jgi:uncharacterized membrane protein
VTRARAGILLLLGVTLVTFLFGVAIKEPCLSEAWTDGFQYTHLCYNDLQPLYYARHLDERRVPYVQQFLEYPTLTGTEMYLAALVSRSDRSFFGWNAVVLGACALLTTWALCGAVGPTRNVLMFAAAPSLILYGVLNWELLAVAPLAGGLWLWARGRVGWSGAAFGVGAAAKLFPAAALVTGTAALLGKGRRREAGGFATSLLLAWGAWNVPYAVRNGGGWWATWSFHGGRFPDFGTTWYWMWSLAGRPDAAAWRHLVDGVSLGVLGLACGAVVLLQLKRRLPMPAATGAVVAVFLLISKVHSPQYVLWMLPFLVVVPGSWPLFAAYEAVDLAVFVSGFLWFAGWSGTFPVRTAWQPVFVLAVFGRALVLCAIAIHFSRSAGSPSEALDGEGGHDVLVGTASAASAGHRPGGRRRQGDAPLGDGYGV